MGCFDTVHDPKQGCPHLGIRQYICDGLLHLLRDLFNVVAAMTLTAVQEAGEVVLRPRPKTFAE